MLRNIIRNQISRKIQKLEKEREDFIILEKEVNEGKRKVLGKEWFDILGKATRPGNKLTTEEYSLFPRFWGIFRFYLLGKNISERNFDRYNGADEIIEPPIYREVLAYYEEQTAKIAKIKKNWYLNKINWDKMKPIELGLNDFYLEKLEKTNIILKEIDRKIDIHKDIDYEIMKMGQLPMELRKKVAIHYCYYCHINKDITSSLSKRGINREEIRNEVEKASKEALFETKKICSDEISKIFDKKLSIVIEKLLLQIEKHKKSGLPNILSQAYKNYKQRTKLNRMADIFKKYFQQLKTQREQAQSQFSQQQWQEQYQQEQQQQQTYEQAYQQEAERLAAQQKQEAEDKANRRKQIKEKLKRTLTKINIINFLRKKTKPQTPEQPSAQPEPETPRTPPTGTQTGTIVSRYQFFINRLKELGVKIDSNIQFSLTSHCWKKNKKIRKLYTQILAQDQTALYQIQNEEYLAQILVEPKK